MQIEIAKHERMSESGSSLLRLIQNNDTAKLDLLVRESIQNCLDAGDKTSESVHVNFTVGEVETSAIADYFNGINSCLKERYAGENGFIAISDTNTVGLTGPVRDEDIKDNKFGNLHKLVYEISKPQEQSGSGGSWGLGKTVYFRIGIGLVAYYSRIFNEESGDYESRLAAALVEDEMKDETILPEEHGLRRGIAWWGKIDSESENGQTTIPVTDDVEIMNFLSSFGVPAFNEKETGTIIIIPFVNCEKLLNETIPTDVENEYKVPYWCQRGISNYLSIAIQRWYSPRMNNNKYVGQYLDASVNGEKIISTKMAPVFRLIQKLYNARPREEGEYKEKKITSKVIEIRNVFKNTATAGWINYIKVTSEEMGMEAPDNLLSPYYYINKLSSDTMYNDPIILYTRKPGMVVSYETTGDWTDSIPKTANGEYLIAVFVANSENMLSQTGDSFEEYIRGSEKADHMSWDDWTIKGGNPQIITRLKRQVRKKIKDDFAIITSGDGEKKNLGLGKVLADALLPPDDYVYWDDAMGGSTGQGGTGGDGLNQLSNQNVPTNITSHVIIRQTGSATFMPDGISIPIQVLFGKKQMAYIELGVDSERGTISSGEWERNIGKEFPIELKYFGVKEIFRGKGNNRKTVSNEKTLIDHDEVESGINYSFYNTETFNRQMGLKIEVPERDYFGVEGNLVYELSDIQGSISLRGEA